MTKPKHGYPVAPVSTSWGVPGGPGRDSSIIVCGFPPPFDRPLLCMPRHGGKVGGLLIIGEESDRFDISRLRVDLYIF